MGYGFGEYGGKLFILIDYIYLEDLDLRCYIWWLFVSDGILFGCGLLLMWLIYYNKGDVFVKVS